MSESIFCTCGNCKKEGKAEVHAGEDIHCPNCAQVWVKSFDSATVFEKCPLCACNQFYVQKDFNQALGCLLMLIGIILVPKTYGLSLPFFALIDWLLHKRVPNVVLCYRCGAEFRGFKIPSRLKPFMHHIGAKYDKK